MMVFEMCEGGVLCLWDLVVWCVVCDVSDDAIDGVASGERRAASAFE